MAFHKMKTILHDTEHRNVELHPERNKMKLNRAILLSAASLLAALTLTSCGDYVGKEKSHPLFVKAGTCKSSGNFADAAKYFEEFLAICPKSSVAHYEVATLYADSLNQPILAIYHFERSAELAPPNSTDAQDLKPVIEQAKRKAMEKLNEEFKVTPETERLSRELAESKDKLAKYLDYSNKLKAQNDLMRQRLLGGSTGKAAPKPGQGGAAAKPSDAAAPTGGAAKPKADSYKVKPGDTLAKISKEVYGSSSHYKVILDANKDKLPANGALKVGQELRIPQLPSAGAKTE